MIPDSGKVPMIKQEMIRGLSCLPWIISHVIPDRRRLTPIRLKMIRDKIVLIRGFSPFFAAKVLLTSGRGAGAAAYGLM